MSLGPHEHVDTPRPGARYQLSLFHPQLGVIFTSTPVERAVADAFIKSFKHGEFRSQGWNLLSLDDARSSLLAAAETLRRSATSIEDHLLSRHAGFLGNSEELHRLADILRAEAAALPSSDENNE